MHFEPTLISIIVGIVVHISLTAFWAGKTTATLYILQNRVDTLLVEFRENIVSKKEFDSAIIRIEEQIHSLWDMSNKNKDEISLTKEKIASLKG